MARKPRTIIETTYGKVYEDALDNFEKNYDTGVLLREVEPIISKIEDTDWRREESRPGTVVPIAA